MRDRQSGFQEEQMRAVTELSSIDDLSRVRVTWKRLWDQCPEASFFQSWDWLRSYLRVYEDGQKLRALIVSEGSTPVGIVPLVQHNIHTRLGIAGVLRYPLDNHGIFYGPIAQQPGTILASAIQHALRRRDWCTLELGYIDEAGHDDGQSRTVLTESRLRIQAMSTVDHPSVQLDHSWETYLQKHRAHFRSLMEAAESDLSQYGMVSFFRWRPAGGFSGQTDRRWDLFEVFSRIHNASRERTSRTAAEMALLKDAHPAAVDAGAVEICLLSICGRTLACSYGYHRGGTIEQLYTGGLPQVQSAVPVLLDRMIQDSLMRNDRRILFRKPNETIRRWCNSSVSAVTLSHYERFSPQAHLLQKQLAADAR